MSLHLHPEYVEGCFRCALSRDERARDLVDDIEEIIELTHALATVVAPLGWRTCRSHDEHNDWCHDCRAHAAYESYVERFPDRAYTGPKDEPDSQAGWAAGPGQRRCTEMVSFTMYGGKPHYDVCFLRHGHPG